VNHSTVFRRINQFEDSLGVRLFDRLPEGYRLTQAGEELKEHAQRIHGEVDALSLRVGGKDFQPSGVVRITAPDGLVYNYLSHYLKSFCKRYTAITIEINVSNKDLNLSRRKADIAVRQRPVRRSTLSAEKYVHCRGLSTPQRII
jgi:DNA-binding transcriptional LysR family regulator